MNYLYHLVPNPMEGKILYPLNALKDHHSEIYEKAASKYQGRENIMERRIMPLNCSWNDALHLTAAHPQALKDALVQAGMDRSIRMAFYQIDPNILNPENCAIYLHNRENDDVMKENDFVPFNPIELDKYSFIPERTRSYYKEKFDGGSRPLAFAYMPHILYKGPIDMSDSPIIEV